MHLADLGDVCTRQNYFSTQTKGHGPNWLNQNGRRFTVFTDNKPQTAVICPVEHTLHFYGGHMLRDVLDKNINKDLQDHKGSQSRYCTPW